MADLKTIPTRLSVDKFLRGIMDETKREDCYQILKMMEGATKSRAKMWGTSIVGFGDLHYVYESGREGNWFLVGFSPRKQNLTLYSASGFLQFEDLIKRLGRHSTGKGCLYINKLEDVDKKVLKELISKSAKAAVNLKK